MDVNVDMGGRRGRRGVNENAPPVEATRVRCCDREGVNDGLETGDRRRFDSNLVLAKFVVYIFVAPPTVEVWGWPEDRRTGGMRARVANYDAKMLTCEICCQSF